MLKDIFQKRLNNANSVESPAETKKTGRNGQQVKEQKTPLTSIVSESQKTVIGLDNTDQEIDSILPMMDIGEHEHDEYRKLLKQLKRRNPAAYGKAINFD